jgi:hypothetical protein
MVDDVPHVVEYTPGFHMAMGEKKWEKLVNKDCAGK